MIGLTAFAFYASPVGEPLFGQLLDDRLSVPPARTAGGRVKV